MGRKYMVNLAGESFRQPAIGRCLEGQRVDFRHDVGNAYDDRAIAVYSGRGEMIGFLPRDGWLTEALLDQGARCDARISKIHPPEGKRPHRAVVLEVEIL